jgi:hypothetical protein
METQTPIINGQNRLIPRIYFQLTHKKDMLGPTPHQILK